MSAGRRDSIWIFGEVLFDHLPSGHKVLGGAPFNVAWHLSAFGLRPLLISRVGADESGAQILDAMRHWGMDTSEVQVDERLATGSVEVTITSGEPSYDILAECAYDEIALPRGGSCDFLYHGSLAVRSDRSLATLRAIRARGARQVFVDVNLRAPWWHKSRVLELLRGTDWVKLNQSELRSLSDRAGTGRRAAARMLDQNDIGSLLITRGEAGAEWVFRQGEAYSVRPEEVAEVTEVTEVADTIGAGDAFSAVAILGIVHRWQPADLLARAQQFASLIVATSGATLRDRTIYDELRRQWQADD